MAQLLPRPFSTGDFPELDAIRALIRRADGLLRSEVLHEVVLGKERLPLHCLELGTTDPRAPAVGFFGGIHGVERIGAQVLIAFLQTLIERLHWDESLRHMLELQTKEGQVPDAEGQGQEERARAARVRNQPGCLSRAAGAGGRAARRSQGAQHREAKGSKAGLREGPRSKGGRPNQPPRAATAGAGYQSRRCSFALLLICSCSRSLPVIAAALACECPQTRRK